MTETGPDPKNLVAEVKREKWPNFRRTYIRLKLAEYPVAIGL